MPNLTGSPLASKKFLAYLLADLSWKAIMLLTLFWGQDTMPNQMSMVLIAIVLVGGFLEVGYILGQTYIDKYVQVAQVFARDNPAGDPPEDPAGDSSSDDAGSVGGSPVQPND